MTTSLADDQQRLYAARVSLVVGVLIMLCKFFTFRLTASEAVLSDALESIVNVVSAGMVLLTIRLTSKPADRDHPYGHGKVEYFSSAFEGGLVAFAALLICIEAAGALIYGHELHQLGLGLYLVVIAGLGNLWLGLFLKQRGKRLKSEALLASGSHILSDVWTSIGVLAGLLIVRLTGWVWVDAVFALGVGVYLATVGVGIVRRSIAGLMDEEDPQILHELAQVMQPHMTQGIIDVHEMKLIRSGRNHHLDFHLVLPEFWDVTQVHNRVKEFEAAVFENYPYSGEMHFHYDPCRKNYCQHCDLDNCPIRQVEFEPHMQQVAIKQSQSETTLL